MSVNLCVKKIQECLLKLRVSQTNDKCKSQTTDYKTHIIQKYVSVTLIDIFLLTSLTSNQGYRFPEVDNS